MLAGPVLVLTQSRGSLMGFAAAVMMLLGLRWRRLGIALVVAAVVGIAGSAVLGPQQLLEGMLQLDQTDLSIGGSLIGRQEIWSRAIFMIQDFPFTGIGLNTFPLVLDNLYPSFLAGPEARIPHAHNIYLQTAVDLGLAGLMAFVGLWMIVAWGAVKAYRRAPDQLTKGAMAGLGAGSLAYLVYGLTDAITLGAKPLALLWVMVGLIVAGARMPMECGASAPLSAALSRGEGPHPKGVGLQRLWRRLGVRGMPPVLEIGRTLWMLYWTFAVLLALAAYLVAGISISGWVP